jgi:hypothetical protein
MIIVQGVSVFAVSLREKSMPAPSTSYDPQAVVQPEVFRTPTWMRYFSLIATLALAVVAGIMVGFAIVLVFAAAWALAALCAAVGVFLAALTGYVLRDLRGRWGLRVELMADRMELDLPSGRSLIHRPPNQHLTIPYADVEAVETRFEAYPSLGMQSVQRPFVLSLKAGDKIFLFEDRALGSAFATPMYEPIANAIVERAHVPLRELGMVEGSGGFLSVWGAHSPDWAAPSLPLEQQLRIWRQAAWTGSLALGIVFLAVIIKAAGY